MRWDVRWVLSAVIYTCRCVHECSRFPPSLSRAHGKCELPERIRNDYAADRLLRFGSILRCCAQRIALLGRFDRDSDRPAECPLELELGLVVFDDRFEIGAARIFQRANRLQHFQRQSLRVADATEISLV